MWCTTARGVVLTAAEWADDGEVVIPRRAQVAPRRERRPAMVAAAKAERRRGA